ncbi:hypothetical protein ABZ923_40140 [Streptomyces sp. NPDC046881]|uniref:hypothetical protein n=1 Tax=Streptomyces sp. NPDC046881 TaxID=3155374 RepID=UPI003400AB41
MFTTYQAEAPSVLRMRCVRHALEGHDVAAEFLISASSGHGMAACGEHREVTTRVLADFTGTDDVELQALFALTGLSCTGEPLMVVAEPDRPERRALPLVPARLLELHGRAREAAREAGPRDGDKLIAALAVYGVPSWLHEDCGVSYVIAGVDRTRDEGLAHTGPKVFLYSGENADLAPADHTEPWACALYGGDGEFVDILFTAQAGMGLDAECAHAALCLTAWLDEHADRHPRA